MIWVAVGLGSLLLTVTTVASGDAVAPDGPAPWMLVEAAVVLVLIFIVGRWASGPTAVGVFALGLCFGLSVLRFPDWGPLQESLPARIAAVTLWTGIAWLIGVLGQGLRRLHRSRVDADLARTHEHVAVQLARQRLRIGRELHDFVGHDVSEVVALCQMVPFVDHQSERLQSVVAGIERAGMRSLSSLDVAVEAMQEPDPVQPGAGIIRSVIGRFNEERGGAVDWVDETQGQALPSAISALVYRTVLETLTNMERHAPGTTAAIRLTSSPTTVVLTATDSGRIDGETDAAQGRDGGGQGLRGLTASAGELGGTVTAGPDGAGWRLELVLPLEPT